MVDGYIAQRLQGVQLTRKDADELIAMIESRVREYPLTVGHTYLDKGNNVWIARRNRHGQLGVISYGEFLSDEPPRVLVHGVDRSFPEDLVEAAIVRHVPKQESGDDG